jgi:hypothetical protein
MLNTEYNALKKEILSMKEERDSRIKNATDINEIKSILKDYYFKIKEGKYKEKIIKFKTELAEQDKIIEIKFEPDQRKNINLLFDKLVSFYKKL